MNETQRDIERTRLALELEEQTRESARRVVSSAGRALSAVESARKRIEAERDEIAARQKRAAKMIPLIFGALIGLIVLSLYLAIHARSLAGGG